MIKFRSIFLMLGKACDQNCTYCIQQSKVAQKNKAALPIKINERIYDYIREVAKYPMDDKLNLIFLGGEPLLYWGTIKQIVENLEGENIRFVMITNGMLMDKEKLDFINAHDFSIDLSFDGRNVKDIRLYDVFNTSAAKYIYGIHNLAVEAVVTSMSYPLDIVSRAREINRIANAATGSLLDVIIEPLVVLEQCKGFEDIDRKRMADDWYSIIKTAHSGNISADTMPIISAYKNSIGKYVSARANGFKSIFGLCPDEYTSLHMDVSGTLHACHNINNPIGTIDDTINTIFTNMAIWDEQFHFDRSKCESCEINTVCKDMCRLHEDSEKYCRYLLAYFGSIQDAMNRWENEGNTLKGAEEFEDCNN